MNIYFDKEEEAFIRAQENGWVRELIHQIILNTDFAFEENVKVEGRMVTIAVHCITETEEEVEEAREHFPPEPVRDVFGPGLKRR